MATTADKSVLKAMMDNACHFGHKASKWNPKMRRYIYGTHNGVHVLDLAKSHELLQRAQKFISDEVSKGKTVLMVCTKLQAKRLIEDEAKRAGVPYVTTKWIPGLLTNYKTLKQRINYLRDLKDKLAAGEFDRYTKREALEFKKQIEKLGERLGGVEEMLKMPDVLFVGDGVRDMNAILEARKLGIPVVGIVDSNADPDLMTYPIPGNDDAIKSLTFFVTQIANAIVEAKKKK